MRIAPVLFVVFLIASCNQQEQAPPEAKRVYGYPQAESSWLDTSGRLYTERRAVSPDGVDIRAAAYQISGEDLQLVLQLRNYDARVPDSPDNQWLVQAEVFDKVAEDVELPDGQVPVRMLPTPDHQQVLLQTAIPDADGRVSDQNTHLLLLDAQGESSPISGADSLYPAQFTDSGSLECWTVNALQLDRGLLHSTRKLGDGASWINLDGSEATAPPSWMKVSADPVSPARSMVSYYVDIAGNALPEDVEWNFPYHMSYSSESWLPPLFRLPGGRLATLLFQPDARGPSQRANYNGIFRLATLDPDSGTVNILHEDIPPKLTILEQDGVLFYCCPTDGEESVRWEIWATDVSGLNKRMLFTSDDSIYINLADVAGQRLLFFRQYFAREDTAPVLFSELQEVSTEGLGRGLVQLESRLGGMADGIDSGIPPISF
ncbi:MAG: hypothetical protein H7A35_10725 [Planctomycetales bacterium]|nr:hypothetical protein [bacterium]UNM07343.1 MAG: hypothetical protein H7A35_10725 [Planctomycetales bacterium]